MRVIYFLIYSSICTAIALLPETAMWLTYGLIAPTSEIGKILTIGMFWLCGGGLCIAFGALGFLLWLSFTQELLK